MYAYKALWTRHRDEHRHSLHSSTLSSFSVAARIAVRGGFDYLGERKVYCMT